MVRVLHPLLPNNLLMSLKNSFCALSNLFDFTARQTKGKIFPGRSEGPHLQTQGLRRSIVAMRLDGVAKRLDSTIQDEVLRAKTPIEVETAIEIARDDRGSDSAPRRDPHPKNAPLSSRMVRRGKKGLSFIRPDWIPHSIGLFKF